MKKTVFVSMRFFIAVMFAFLALANIQIASAQNVTFNGYWELPDGNFFLVKERLYLFVNTDGKLMGAGGCFSYNNNQFSLQTQNSNKISFSYTVIDSGSIRVTDTSGKYAKFQGVWKKRANVPGTSIKLPIIGYWEARIGDTTWVLYFTGSDITPPKERTVYRNPADGFVYDFDKENNLISAHYLLFHPADGKWSDRIQLNFSYNDDTVESIRFDGKDMLVEPAWWMGNPMPTTEVRFVKK